MVQDLAVTVGAVLKTIKKKNSVNKEDLNKIM